MLVKELIEYLKKCDENLEVYTIDSSGNPLKGEGFNTENVVEIKCNKDKDGIEGVYILEN